MFTRISALLLAAGAAAAGYAQQPATTGNEPPADIVVEGVRNQDRQISDFVNALTKAPFGGQLSRFDWAVCPAVVGLTDANRAAVAERMRRVAASAGIKVAGSGCRPNALVIVTRDKKDFIKGLRAKFPAYFEGVSDSRVEDMLEDAGPAAAWHVEGRLDADGIEVPRDAVTGVRFVERTDVASRVSMASRPHFVASIVVVELDALKGLTATQLGDYAAMRAFARTEPSRLNGQWSILNVIDAPMDSAVPITLTEWDLAFLKSLYGSSADRLAKQQRGEMKRLMEKDLQGPTARE